MQPPVQPPPPYPELQNPPATAAPQGDVQRVYARPLSPPSAWRNAARGLARYRSAFIIQLIAGISIGVLAVFAAENAIFLLVIAAFVTAITSALMASGAYGYATQPGESSGAGTAKLASFMFIAVAILKVVELGMTLMLTSGSHVSEDSLNGVSLIGGLAGLIGLFALLSSMQSVATFLAHPDLARRVREARNMFIITIALVFGTVFLAIAAGPLGLLGAIALLVCGIIAIVRYISVLGNMVSHIDYHSHGPL